MVVITLAETFIKACTGQGSGAAPAASAWLAWRASSARIWSTMAREAWSAAGKRSRCEARWASTWTACRIAHLASHQPQAKGTDVPQGVEQRGPSAQLVQALLRPGQVVFFLLASLAEMLAQARIARAQGLGGIKRLGADFTHVVHAHQARRMGALLR